MKQYKWCAIDAEGDVGNAGLLGVAFYSEEYRSYDTNKELIQQALKHHAVNGYTFICHNAQYDIPVIFWQLGIPVKCTYYNNRFNKGTWHIEEAALDCEIWDTLGLSGGLSLRQLGKSLNLPKYDTPQVLTGKDPDKYTWKCDEHGKWECIECYAVRDAEICYKFMQEFAAQLTAWGVEPQRKLAGIAQATWRTLENPDPIYIRNPKIKKLARESYHGGRVETFKLGTLGPVYTADVVSMYPSVMKDASFPDPTSMVYLKTPSRDTWLDSFEGCAEVDITVPAMYAPPLCCMYDGELHYPVGRLHGYWTFAELRYAESLGCSIEHIQQAAYGTHSYNPFSLFIDMLWQMRQEFKRNGDPRQLLAKLIMNNLYGRLGLKEGLKRRTVFLAEKGIPIKKQVHNAWYVEDGTLFLELEEDMPSMNKWSNVLWAAQITALARIKLHQFIQLQGNNILYCDTDSIFSRTPIIGVGEGLGSLQLEGEYAQAVIAAPKLYALQEYSGEWEAKARGVPKSVALEFLRTGIADFSEPIKPLSQSRRRIKAGTWVDVHQESMRRPARRQPLDPTTLLDGTGYSDTSPLVILPS